MPLSQKLSAACAIAFAVFAAPPAMASTSDLHIKTKEISILGFDLSDRADAARLLTRIKAASKSVCTISVNRQTVGERKLRDQCADEAAARAVQTLKSPTLTAVWREAKEG